MGKFADLFEKYDRLVLFDTETTGLQFSRDEIIEFAAVVVEQQNGEAVVLVKPQFECENKNIGKSGIVHTSAHTKIVEKVVGYALENGLYPFGITNAPIRKGKNIEYVLWLKPHYNGAKSLSWIVNEVKNVLENITNERKTKDE